METVAPVEDAMLVRARASVVLDSMAVLVAKASAVPIVIGTGYVHS